MINTLKILLVLLRALIQKKIMLSEEYIVLVIGFKYMLFACTRGLLIGYFLTRNLNYVKIKEREELSRETLKL